MIRIKSLALSGLAAFAGSSLALASECREFGLPSYTTSRLTEVEAQKIPSKVFVSGENEREETKIGDRVVIRIQKGTMTTTFDETSKTGVQGRLPPPPQAPINKNDPNVKNTKTKTQDRQTVVIQVKNGAEWAELIKVVCRLDGVLLERRYPVGLPGGKFGRAVVTHSDIEVKALPADLFEVPAHIKLKTQ